MKENFFKTALYFVSLTLLAASCQKEKLYDAPTGSYTSYMTEYCIGGIALDTYTARGSAYYEKIDFDDLSGKCTLTINGFEYQYDYTVNKNIIQVGDKVTFKIAQNSGSMLVLAVDVTGDPNAKSVFEYDRGEGLLKIYSNYTSFEGTQNRCFWYMDGKKRVFCYPVVGSKYFDRFYSEGKSLSFYDQIQYHFRKSR